MHEVGCNSVCSMYGIFHTEESVYPVLPVLFFVDNYFAGNRADVNLEIQFGSKACGWVQRTRHSASGQ